MKMNPEWRWRRVVIYLFVLLFIQYAIFSGRVGYLSYGFSMRVFSHEYFMDTPKAQMAAARAVFLPFSREQTIIPVGDSGWELPLHSPAELIQLVARIDSHLELSEIWPLVLSGIDKDVRWDHVEWQLLAALCGLCTMFCLLCPVSFILMPEHRRQLKGKRGHLLRITLYGLFMLSIPTGYAIVILMGRKTADFDSIAIHERMRMLYLLAIPLAQFVWWSLAIRCYLKMPHAWRTGFIITLIAFVLSPVMISCVLTFAPWWS